MFQRRREISLVAAAVLAMALGAACGGGSPAAPARAVYVVDVVGERFRILLSDGERIAEARRILAGEESQKIVAGRLLAGDGGFNDGYGWHMDPATVQFADASVEVCDGRPSAVEANLDYWLNTLGQYCPWAARIVAEEAAPD